MVLITIWQRDRLNLMMNLLDPVTVTVSIQDIHTFGQIECFGCNKQKTVKR